MQPAPDSRSRVPKPLLSFGVFDGVAALCILICLMFKPRRALRRFSTVRVFLLLVCRTTSRRHQALPSPQRQHQAVSPPHQHLLGGHRVLQLQGRPPPRGAINGGGGCHPANPQTFGFPGAPSTPSILPSFSPTGTSSQLATPLGPCMSSARLTYRILGGRGQPPTGVRGSSGRRGGVWLALQYCPLRTALRQGTVDMFFRAHHP